MRRTPFLTHGSVLIDGKDVVKEKRTASLEVGWVPEFPNFDQTSRPIPLLKYHGRFYDIERRETESRIESLIRSVGLSGHTGKRLRDYSQGMKKRFSLALALLSDSRNLLLDESLNGLDPEGIKYGNELVLSMKKQGKAIFLSSHILSELENIADRIAIIKSGKLLTVVDRSELPRLGSKIYIRISVRNPDEAIFEILGRYREIHSEGKDIILTNLKVDAENAALLNNELVRAGYSVIKFVVEGESLRTIS
jgi:ABC-2 type transport system ATP-binding protein